MSSVIKVENVSKQYRLGTISTGALSHDINRLWHKLTGREDPYSKIGDNNDRSGKKSSDYVWALKDINFEVNQGEVLGIIGRNGAGKSTLLKILSRTTAPTTGSIKIKGRVASLLEVGTGFHPELSGRDNIFLNGAIMGMTKKEIQKKFDEIVDFAGVERYIDTPVKRYSSGMYVRLAFAVAAHLEPDILIVDEVLAVGDAEFQKKCLGKMKDVSINDGRTVLFVSHNMPSIKSLCNNAVLLENGMLLENGTADEIVRKYVANNIDIISSNKIIINDSFRRAKYSKEIEFISVEFESPLYENCFATQLPITLKIEVKSNIPLKNFRIAGSIFSYEHEKLGTFFSNDLGNIEHDVYKFIKLQIISHHLASGKYYFALSLGNGNEETGNVEYDIIYELMSFQITHKKDLNTPIVKWPLDWGAINFQTNSKIVLL